MAGGSKKWVLSEGEDRYRRGLYTYWRRAAPYPGFMNFDAPSREACTVSRSRTNTPLQALTVMNDPVYVEAAATLAVRVLTDRSDADLEAQLTWAFRRCVARSPATDELRVLADLYRQQLAGYQADPEAARDMAQQAAGNLPPGVSVEALAAWTVVANVLLNLDEVLTKG